MKTIKKPKKNNWQVKVTKNDLIGKIIEKYPTIEEQFILHGMYCAGCYLNQYETIEIGAKSHGLSDRDIEKLIEDINNQLEADENRK